jgi:molecular chaperone DnaK
MLPARAVGPIIQLAARGIVVGKMIGIDLGTTKSRVAVMENGVPQLIPNQEGAYATPSTVGLTAKGFRLIGQIAERQALTNPTNTVVGVKRIIGRKFDSPEVAQARHLLSCQLVRAPDGDVHIQVGGKVYSPPEIASFVLQKLKAAAEDYLGAAVEGAVVTVPTYFNDSQREATREAGIIADLEVMPFLDEPTAAALACGPNPAGQSGRFVAVYDLGGGTFSITILEMAEGVFQVRATDGDIFLGGEDFDQRIIGWLVAEFQRETEVDLMRDGETLQRVRDAAERAKCELSMAAQTEIVLPLVPGARRLRTVLSRQRYEDLTHDLIERTIEPSKRCLSKAGLKPEQIDMVLLVGGQTRAPKVSEIVRNVFGKEPTRVPNPDEAVALGAAIQAGINEGKAKDVSPRDVTPHTLGIETKDGTFTPLIMRHSTIPTRRTRVFTTVNDNQQHVEVHVLQGESDVAAYNKSLAWFELTDIPLAPKGVPQIEVAFEVDVHGILSVQAQDRTTGRTLGVVIHPSNGLSQAEVTRLAIRARARDTRGGLARRFDNLVANAKRFVQVLKGKLTSMRSWWLRL